MARPELIARIHEAKYELQTALLQEKEARLKKYENLLNQAAKEYGCSPYELKQVLHDDYRRWLRELKIPPPRPRFPHLGD